MDSYDYLKNQLTIYLSDNLAAHRIDISTRAGFKLGQNNWNILSDSEKYISTIFDIYQRLNHVIENLSHSSTFIRRIPARAYLLKNGINELSYLRYHLEVYVHKIHTVLELMRLLVNAALEFNIPEKDCSWENLRKCESMKGSTIEKILNSYFKSFKDHIKIRHFNTHRGMFKDSEIDELSTPLMIYENARKFKMDVSDYNILYPEAFLKMQIKELRRKRAINIDASLNAVFDHTKGLADILFKDVKKRHLSYKASEKN